MKKKILSLVMAMAMMSGQFTTMGISVAAEELSGTPVDAASVISSTPVDALEEETEETTSTQQSVVANPYVEEYKDRALVAINLGGETGAETKLTATDSKGNEITEGVYLSWRAFDEDFDEDNNVTTKFTVYCNGVAIASDISVTNMVYEGGKADDVYTVVGSNDSQVNGGLKVVETSPWDQQYLELNLYAPADQTMPTGAVCTYSANDMSVGDVDGDGTLELVVKWYPSNAKDNSQSGYTGTTIIDAYDIDWVTGDARLMTRTDMGVNIRSGAHYTQFQVWDYDGDGKAEMAVKTCDGTTTYASADGTDQTLTEVAYVGNCDASALPTDTVSENYDYRKTNGHITSGPEYFSIFNLDDGTKAADDVDYVAYRDSGDWGDSKGNRGERYLAATAFLDGETPYAVMCRGYYVRTTLTAYHLVDTNGDNVGDKIEVYWNFDTKDAENYSYRSQGNHNLSVNDVDGDGKDEIIYGAMALDDDGSKLWNTGLGHGDAMHVGDWVDWNDGLEVFKVGEESGAKYQVEMLDAATGNILAAYFVGTDVGRGLAADIDPTEIGAEFWATAGPKSTGEYACRWDSTDSILYSSQSTTDNLIALSNRSTPSANASIYWDGDLLAEIQDQSFIESDYVPVGSTIYKWNYETDQQEKIFYSEEIYCNNGTKGNFGIIADLLGDWREEFIARSSTDANKVRVYSTTIQTDYVVPCLLENRAYREGVAWENTAYNQPAHTSYLISKGLVTAKLSLAEKTEDSATINWTAACDGTLYGHDIQGYELYKAVDDGEYQLIATLGADQLTYTDTDFDINADSYYKVAAIVDSKTSYMSMPLAVYIDSPVSVNEINDINVTVGSEAVTLPSTVDVTYRSGDVKEEAVTWNEKEVASINLKKVNSITVHGTTESGLTAEITINVKAATSDTAFKFDFGISSSTNADGWTTVTVNKKKGKNTASKLGINYTKDRGYGFLGDSVVIEGREESYTVDGADLPKNVYKDFCLPDGKTFVVDIANGKYKVDITTGSEYKSTLSATVEGTSVSGGNALQEYSTVSTEVEVADGQLTIDFTSGTTNRIDAIVVTPIVEAVADNHELIFVEGKAATCEEEGMKDYYYCQDCGSYYLDAAGENEVYYYELFIDPTGHSQAETTVENLIKATTSADGSYDSVVYCKNCGQEMSRITSKIAKVSSIELVGGTTYKISGNNNVQPEISVTDEAGNQLTSGVDYTVEYPSTSAKTGVYTAKVTLTGNYEGSKTLTYYVVKNDTQKTIVNALIKIKATISKIISVITGKSSGLSSLIKKLLWP